HRRYLPSFPTRRSSDLYITATFPYQSKAPEPWALKVPALLEVLFPGARNKTFPSSRPYRSPERSHESVRYRPLSNESLSAFRPSDRKSTRLNSSHVKIS